MPTPTQLQVLPSRGLLTEFLRQRQSRTVAGAAALLGWTPAQVRERALEEQVLLGGNVIPWRTVASWLVETWPLRLLLDAIGDDTLLPTGLHLTQVTWELPYYIAHAMRVQAAIEVLPHLTVRPATESDYMRDLLHRSIDGETIAVLRRDPDFLEAFEFPFGDAEE